MLVLLALADYASKKDATCYPSLPELADKTGLGTSTVRRVLRSLEAMGAIKADVSAGGRHVRSTYTLAVETVLETQPERAGNERVETQPLRSGQNSVTQPERAGFKPETQPERRETQPERARNPTRAGGVVPKTGHRTSQEPTTGAAAASRRGTGELFLLDSPPVQGINSGNVATAWIDTFRREHPGTVETNRQKLQAAREARNLIEAGNDPARVLAAAESAAAKGYSTVEREFTLLASRTPVKAVSGDGFRHQPYRDADPADYESPILPKQEF